MILLKPILKTHAVTKWFKTLQYLWNIYFNRLAWKLWTELELSQPTIIDKCSVWYDAALCVHIQKATFEMFLKSKFCVHVHLLYTYCYKNHATACYLQQIMTETQQFPFPLRVPITGSGLVNKSCFQSFKSSQQNENQISIMRNFHHTCIKNKQFRLGFNNSMHFFFFFFNRSSTSSSSSVCWLCSPWTADYTKCRSFKAAIALTLMILHFWLPVCFHLLRPFTPFHSIVLTFF